MLCSMCNRDMKSHMFNIAETVCDKCVDKMIADDLKRHELDELIYYGCV